MKTKEEKYPDLGKPTPIDEIINNSVNARKKYGYGYGAESVKRN